MKYLSLFLFCFVNMVFSQIVFENSLDWAFLKAKEQHKKVFIEYYRKDCHACELLEPFLKEKNNFTDYYNQNFISYRIEISDENTTDVQFLIKEKKLYFDATPILLFFDENKNLIHYASVLLNSDKLLEIGKTALDNSENLIGLEQKYLKGEKNIKILYNLSLYANVKKDKEQMMKLNDELFTIFPTEQLSSTKSYIILKQCIISVENGFYKHWISHWKDLELLKEVKEQDLDARKKILLNIAIKDANENQNTWNLTKIRWVKSFLPLLDKNLALNDLFWENEIRLLVENNEKEEAQKLAYTLVEKENFNRKNCEYYLKKFKEFFPEKKDQKKIEKWFNAGRTH